MAQLNITSSIVDYLKSKGQSYDLSSRKKIYEGTNLGNRLGSYIGTGEQNEALLNYMRNTQTKTSPAFTPSSTTTSIKAPSWMGGQSIQTPSWMSGGSAPVSPTTKTPSASSYSSPTPTTPSPTGTSTEVPQSILDQWNAIKGRITEEGITDAQGNMIVPPSGETPETGGINTSNFELPATELQNTDLANILKGITEGEINSTDLAVATEAKRLAEEGEQGRAAAALNKAQQAMAKRGMTFSGIRTSEEAALAAESLSRMTGISNEFASKIIKAAKEEQTNRIKANQFAQEQYTKALSSMGYVIDPITGNLTKTLGREQLEKESAPKVIGNSKTGYYQWNPETGRYDIPAMGGTAGDGTKTVPSNKKLFTQTQLNKGAATARRPLNDFMTFDDDTKNYFISNASDVNAKYKIIEKAKANEENPTELEAEISDSSLPAEVKNSLVSYLWTVFPRPTGTPSKNTGIIPGAISGAKNWITNLLQGG